jgi:hypothetical protein
MNNTVLKTDNDFEIIPFEKCVVCDKETNMSKNLNIDHRQFYIEGAGQLCKTCYDNLDNRKYIKL